MARSWRFNRLRITAPFRPRRVRSPTRVFPSRFGSVPTERESPRAHRPRRYTALNASVSLSRVTAGGIRMVPGPGDQAGMSCQRPFRRRRLSVFRPPLVCIRWRNPCVFFRLRFDLLRRCFFMAGSSTLYGVALNESRRNRLSHCLGVAIITRCL